MNIFDIYLNKIKNIVTKNSANLKIPQNLSGINVDTAPSKFKADISTNVCMVLSSLNKLPPTEIYKQLNLDDLKNEKDIENIEFVKPGFVNIKFVKKFWNTFLTKMLNDQKYGASLKNDKKNYLLEFVSANPTGPLHVGHCRGAIYGDALCNLLKFCDHKVTKEYYVNDHGNQIKNFSLSVYFRIKEKLFNEEYPKDENLYPGDYIIEIAEQIISKNSIKNYENYEKISDELSKLSVVASLEIIKKNLNSLGVVHDNFVSENNIINSKEVDEAIDNLKKNNLVFKGKIEAPEGEDKSKWVEREQLLFKSTNYGDDKDRALTKSDNSWTYFAGDIAYHNNKLKRNFDEYINILGADHAGYIKRINSVVDALSNKKKNLICKVTQLVKLIKDGKPFKMSKRKGDYIIVDDLVNEVGKDATRFIMLSRSNDVQLEFDFEKVKEKSKDNPLYYVQYAYARISSVFRHLDKDIESEIDIKNFNFEYSKEEIDILKKISEWPKCIDSSSHKLEPHRIPIYLYELASLFHSYWNLGKDNPEKRFINDQKKISDDKIIFLKVISNVIRSGMNIVGVSTPKKM